MKGQIYSLVGRAPAASPRWGTELVANHARGTVQSIDNSWGLF